MICCLFRLPFIDVIIAAFNLDWSSTRWGNNTPSNSVLAAQHTEAKSPNDHKQQNGVTSFMLLNRTRGADNTSSSAQRTNAFRISFYPNIAGGAQLDYCFILSPFNIILFTKYLFVMLTISLNSNGYSSHHLQGKKSHQLNADKNCQINGPDRGSHCHLNRYAPNVRIRTNYNTSPATNWRVYKAET